MKMMMNISISEFLKNYTKEITLIQYFAKPDFPINDEKIATGMKLFDDENLDNMKNS